MRADSTQLKAVCAALVEAAETSATPVTPGAEVVRIPGENGENFDLDAALGLIGDYGLTDDDSAAGQEALKQVKESETAKACLYEGVEQTETGESKKEERKQFLKDLHARFATLSDNPGKFDPIGLKELLGDKLFEQYKRAVAEEAKDPQFRDAVFVASTVGLDGSPASPGKRAVIYFGGPSAAGKSHGRPQITDHLIEQQKQNGHTPSEKQYLTSVDGGIERECSQMMQMVIQLAINKGYSGIDDLHENTKLKIKGKVNDAVDQMENNFHKILPITFANPQELIDLRHDLRHPAENTEIIFARVTGPKKTFRKTVVYNGYSRAYLTRPLATSEKSFRMNRKKLPECKKYRQQFFLAGDLGSRRAESMALKHGTGSVLIFESDNLHVNENGDVNDSQENLTVNHVSQREVDLWKALKEAEPKSTATPEMGLGKDIQQASIVTRAKQKMALSVYCDQNSIKMDDEKKEAILESLRDKDTNAVVDLPSFVKAIGEAGIRAKAVIRERR